MIAIHQQTKGFTPTWIKYCEEYNVPYRLVNCYDNNIIDQLKGCKGLMWNWSHIDHKAALMARELTQSLEKAGVKVFPNSDTAWHYDDKLGQKYLLESVGAPLVPTYVFYDKKTAKEWVNQTTFPKVFKTRNGAGSINVRLVRNKGQAIQIISKCFGKGIKTYRKTDKVKNKLWQFKRDKTLISFVRLLKHFSLLFLPFKKDAFQRVEKDYAYFQDFIPNCSEDYRMKVIGNRCWGIIRKVRTNDFRASGSGVIDFDENKIPLGLVKLSFDLSKRMGLQSVAFDYIISNGTQLLIEASYTFGKQNDKYVSGYWCDNLNWHKASINPPVFIIQDFLASLKYTNTSKHNKTP